jgi:uncharacterized membrane protein
MMHTFVDPNLLGFSGLQQVDNIHPAFVHFPLALFPSALLLYGLGVMRQRATWLFAGRACLYLAVAGTALTLITGWQAQGTFAHNERIHHMMMTHLRLGLIVGVCAVVLAGWSVAHRDQQPRGVYGFLTLLAVTTYLVLQNGDLGSRMVYVEGAAVRTAIPKQAHEHHQQDQHHQHAH